jgi:hypothetical protein
LGKDTSVSTIWTPSGEHRPDEGPSPADDHDPTPQERAEVEAELRRMRAELVATPVADIVANHAVGLWELAVLHLAPPPGPDGAPAPPDLTQAGLAIDALGALVDGLGDRLGPHAATLRDAVAQLRIAYVQLSAREPA